MKQLASMILILVGALIVIPSMTNSVHANPGTGIVCIAPPKSNSCPTLPFTFGNLTAGSSLTIGVFIQNSDPMGGFDIYVKTDNTVLNPVSASFGPLIAHPSLSIRCINDISLEGSCTQGTTNGPGVVEMETTESSGQNECFGQPTCSDMAFNITYNVVSGSGSTPISYPKADGCISSTTDPTDCVLVFDNFGNVLSENPQTGSFTNAAPAANFAAVPTLGPAPLTVSFNASSSVPSPGNTISKYNWAFGDGTIANITSPTTVHTYNDAGNYSATLEVQDSGGLPSAIKGPLTISVLCSFICATPSSLTIIASKNTNSTISLTGITPFNGTITLAYQVSPSVPNAPTGTFNTTSVNVSPGQTRFSKLTISTVSSTPTGSYTFNVTGSAGSIHHFIIIAVKVTFPDFQVSPAPSTLTLSQGQNSISNITLTSLSGFSGTITLKATNSSNNVLGFLSQSTVKLTSARPTNSSLLYVLVQSSTPAGSYKITVRGNSIGLLGPLIHSANVTVVVPPPDFIGSAAPTSLQVKSGSTGTNAITITGLNGFTGVVNLSANSSSTLGINPSLSPASVTITSTSGPVASGLTISTLGTTPTGTYTVQVTASTTQIQRYVNITLIVLPSLPSIKIDTAIVSANSAVAGNRVNITVSVANTGAVPANVTVVMDVSTSSGSNITVAQQRTLVTPGQPDTIVLSWDTSQWSSDTYRVYARVIGEQTSAVNQSLSAGQVTLAAPQSPRQTSLDILPWITTTVATAAAVALGVLQLRGRHPRTESA